MVVGTRKLEANN